MNTLTLHLHALVADILTTAKHGFRLWRADIRELWIIHRDLRRALMLMTTRPSHASPEHGEAMFLLSGAAFLMAHGRREGRWRPGHCRLLFAVLCRRGFMLSPVVWAIAWEDGLQAEWLDDGPEDDLVCD